MMEQRMLTEWGEKTLLKHVHELIIEYIDRPESKYPFMQGIILGIPFFRDSNFDRVYENKRELLNRIKSYAVILGMSTYEIKRNGAKIIFSLKGDKHGRK